MYSYSICIFLGAGLNVSVFYLYLSISKVFAFIFVSADNNHSQRAQMPKQVSKKTNFSAKIWKCLHTLENLTNAICICRQIGKLASICILFVFVRVLGPIYLCSICICQACAFGLFGPICQLLNLFVSDAASATLGWPKLQGGNTCIASGKLKCLGVPLNDFWGGCLGKLLRVSKKGARC